MKDAEDFTDLTSLPQSELSEIYCERCVYNFMANQERNSSKKADPN